MFISSRAFLTASQAHPGIQSLNIAVKLHLFKDASVYSVLLKCLCVLTRFLWFNQFVPSFVVFVSPVSFTFVCCVAFVSFLFVSVPNVLHSILSICVCERPVLQEQNCCQRNKVLTLTNQLAINQQQMKGWNSFKRLNVVEAQAAAWSLAGMMFWTNTDADPGTLILLHLNYSRNEL